MRTNERITVGSEVFRCYETEVCLSYEQIKSKLPYVPIDKIRQVLAQNNDFIWVNTGVYSHVSKVEFDENDLHTAQDTVKTKMAERGYASLTSIDVKASLELMPDFSETAARNGLFQVCLADRYEKRGNIITQKGMTFNSVAVFEDHCLSHDRLTLDEIFEFEKEVNGCVNSQLLYVAYDTMVRINKDTFVRDSEVCFNLEGTDNALALFVRTDVIPLRAVTSFTSFPYTSGYPWNWFLLESYCKRFSKNYKFQCLSVSSRNVGAIYRKSLESADYTSVLATAVAAANIKLNEKEVGNYLFENGYVARRTKVVADVVAKAWILRERRVWGDVRIHA